MKTGLDFDKNKKVINPMNLVGFVADEKANKVISFMSLSDAVIETGIRLNKVVLREQAFNTPAGTPFYAFAKAVGELTVLVDVRSGKPIMVDNSVIASMAKVNNEFSIDGVIYGKKDTVNNCPRYVVCRTARKVRAKAMNKFNMLKEVHVAGQ